MQKIYVYISSLIFCMFACSVEAQTTKKKVKEIDNTPLFNGVSIQADAASLLSPLLFGGERYSYEAGLQVDLKHKYYPVFEMGFAGANKISNNDIEFKTSGLFGRIGVDFNFMKPKKDAKPTSNLFLVGVRLGMSSFPYSISNVTVTDNYWGGSETLNYPNQITSKIWFEVVAGIRVEVLKNFYMGWTVRNKNMLTQDATGAVAPWYVPGFGLNNGGNWGFNYNLGYKFQLPTKISTKIKTKK